MFPKVTVSPLSFYEEEKILNSKGKGSSIINKLLEKCVEGVDIHDLVLMDKFYLLTKVREASYGSEYDFDIACPACSTEIKSTLDIGDHLNVRYVPESLEDPRLVDLPMLKVEAKVRFPRVHEESFIEDIELASNNLYRFVVSLDGNEDPVFISKALKRMHIRDLKTLAKEISLNEFGIDPRFLFECPSCGETTMMQIPFGADFFSVS